MLEMGMMEANAEKALKMWPKYRCKAINVAETGSILSCVQPCRPPLSGEQERPVAPEKAEWEIPKCHNDSTRIHPKFLK